MLSALDLGGTKIEAGVFSSDMKLIEWCRIPTPKTSYEDLLAALQQQIEWTREVVGLRQLPLGVGLPGLVDDASGLSFTSNLPATGKPLRADLGERAGQAVFLENDCKCFALSEAVGGDADEFDTVFGLILGTGIGGGVCHHGKLVRGAHGMPGEVGHIGLPAAMVQRYDLPLLTCGCGSVGCYETLCAGPGLEKLCEYRTGKILIAAEIGASELPEIQEVLQLWATLLAELIHTLRLTIDPDCVVLGGGLSKLPKVADLLTTALHAHPFSTSYMPQILLPRFGDSSGLRGAALLAKYS